MVMSYFVDGVSWYSFLDIFPVHMCDFGGLQPAALGSRFCIIIIFVVVIMEKGIMMQKVQSRIAGLKFAKHGHVDWTGELYVRIGQRYQI